jgi:hypothetical protein
VQGKLLTINTLTTMTWAVLSMTTGANPAAIVLLFSSVMALLLDEESVVLLSACQAFF